MTKTCPKCHCTWHITDESKPFYCPCGELLYKPDDVPDIINELFGKFKK